MFRGDIDRITIWPYIVIKKDKKFYTKGAHGGILEKIIKDILFVIISEKSPVSQPPLGVDFLFEIGCEDIPAENQKGLESSILAWWSKKIPPHIVLRQSKAFVTPRRLAVHLMGIEKTKGVMVKKGPLESLGQEAFLGFCRTLAITPEDCRLMPGPKGLFWQGEISLDRVPLEEELRLISIDFLESFSWSKTMRWPQGGAHQWIRPIRTISALLGDRLLDWGWQNISSTSWLPVHRLARAMGAKLEKNTEGASWPCIELCHASIYEEVLESGFVLPDGEKRKARIIQEAQTLAKRAHCHLYGDVSALVVENGALTQWPVALLASFKESFLELPAPIIASALEVHQRCFCLRLMSETPSESCAVAVSPEALVDEKNSIELFMRHFLSGASAAPEEPSLAPLFIAIADGEPRGNGWIAGYEAVVNARLEDALFFWKQDCRVPLSEMMLRLDQRQFFDGLGSFLDKGRRMAFVALAAQRGEGGTWAPAVSKSGGSLDSLVFQGAFLAKSDMASAVVGEFPALQGVMGYYYGIAEGLPLSVAAALRLYGNFFRYPVFLALDPSCPGGTFLHTAGTKGTHEVLHVAATMALADGMDSLVGFFALRRQPTGSKDPLGLRRLCLNMLRGIISGQVLCSLGAVFSASLEAYALQQLLKEEIAQSTWGALLSTLSLPADRALVAFVTGAKGDGHETPLLQNFSSFGDFFGKFIGLGRLCLDSVMPKWIEDLEDFVADRLEYILIHDCNILPAVAKKAATLTKGWGREGFFGCVDHGAEGKDGTIWFPKNSSSWPILRAFRWAIFAQELLMSQNGRAMCHSVKRIVTLLQGAKEVFSLLSLDKGRHFLTLPQEIALLDLLHRSEAGAVPFLCWLQPLEEFFHSVHIEDVNVGPARLGLLQAVLDVLRAFGPLEALV